MPDTTFAAFLVSKKAILNLLVLNDLHLHLCLFSEELCHVCFAGRKLA